MAIVKELIRSEADGNLSFGDYSLSQKAKKEDFEHAGDLFKVKTYATMTKLEKNGLFVYESVPGTSVTDFTETSKGVAFSVEGAEDAQVTLGLEEDTAYEVFIDGASMGKIKTNLGGKLSVSVELNSGREVKVEVRR